MDKELPKDDDGWFQMQLMLVAEPVQLMGPILYSTNPSKEDDNGRTSPDES